LVDSEFTQEDVIKARREIEHLSEVKMPFACRMVHVLLLSSVFQIFLHLGNYNILHSVSCNFNAEPSGVFSAVARERGNVYEAWRTSQSAKR
jgi:hypothetical protein